MHSLTEAPTQKPLQEAELLPEAAIAHLTYLSKVTHILHQLSLIEEGKAEIGSEDSKVILLRSELLVDSACPIILSPTDTYELIKGLVGFC
jgi:hypothetical protein